MAGMSPTDYQRAAKFRRSFSSSREAVEQRRVYAYSVHDIANGDQDPVLGAFLRGGRESLTGVAVTDRMAMRNSVYYRGTSLIAGSMGMLPLSLLRRKAAVPRSARRDLYRAMGTRSAAEPGQSFTRCHCRCGGRDGAGAR